MASKSSARIGSVLLLVSCAVGALGFVRCYNATELVLDLRTTLPCDTFQPKTQIRMGDNGQTVAETVTCETASSALEDPKIGTLTFVPSGDRDAKVVVEVVLAVKGTRPEDCATQPDKCIIASRSFSFIEHSSRRLPIVLRGQCLGKVCRRGETCVEGGVCVAIEAACLIEKCEAEPPTVPGAPPTTTTPTPTPDASIPPPPCANGDTRCVGPRLEECKNGTFELRDLCATADLCSGNKCTPPGTTTCVKGEKRCVGGNVQQCRTDGSGFDTVSVCTGANSACTTVGAPAHCATGPCKAGDRKCDTGCEISGPSQGTSADDCLVQCNADGVFVFEQNCGIAQHGQFSESCRLAPLNGGAECF